RSSIVARSSGSRRVDLTDGTGGLGWRSCPDGKPETVSIRSARSLRTQQRALCQMPKTSTFDLRVRLRFLWIDGLSVDDPFSQINSLGRPVFPGWPATVLPSVRARATTPLRRV